MTLREYILRWQEVYDKNQSRPTTYAAHGQFREWDLPQAREDMVLKDVTVGRVGSRTALVLVVDLLPAENIVFQRHIPTSMHWCCRFRKATHGRPACFSIRLCR